MGDASRARGLEWALPLENMSATTVNRSVKLAGSLVATTGRVQHWFGFSAGILLGVTGIAKVGSTLGSVKLLAVADPIAGIPFRWLLLAVGIVELVIAGICFFGRDKRWASVLVAWLATSFLIYRLGLWWMGWHRPCGCMGSLTEALHLSEQAADNIMKGVLAYLLVGSCGLLCRHLRHQESAARTDPSVLAARGGGDDGLGG